MNIHNIFKRDFENYEGVRPVNIYLLRFLYFLMFVFVGLDAWKTIITHQGSWDPTRAVAWCVWAAYATLSGFGLLNPLRWLPIVIFMVFYKTLWLIVVAYPMWSAGTLAGSPAEGMAQIFIAAPFISLIIPWKYVFEKYFLISKKKK
ncbi:MAG TPA: hypothetical protein PKC91_08785 [Ignavibacteria bacterium]|nr:hypothetical protein [Ignavibacteria bacterium]